MLRIKNGELAELAHLFDRYNVPIFNFFLRLTMDKTASDDLTQSLFYRILRYRESFDTGSFKSWMYQMARNLHIDHCRELQRAGKVIKYVGDFAHDVPGEQDRSGDRDVEQLRRAIEKLGPIDRELIILSRYEGFKYTEIAEMKNISLSAVKVQIHRAVKALRILYFNQ